MRWNWSNILVCQIRHRSVCEAIPDTKSWSSDNVKYLLWLLFFLFKDNFPRIYLCFEVKFFFTSIFSEVCCSNCLTTLGRWLIQDYLFMNERWTFSNIKVNRWKLSLNDEFQNFVSLIQAVHQKNLSGSKFSKNKCQLTCKASSYL